MNIELKYTLDANDYLAYQLYAASTNKRVKKQRIQTWIVTVLLFVLLAFLFYYNDNNILSIYFLVVAVLTALFFPIYSRWRYKKHYWRHTKEIYGNCFGKEVQLILTNDHIHVSDNSGESNINTSQVKNISETREQYFLQLLSSQTLIISKAKLPDIQESIKQLAFEWKIPYTADINWRWK